MRHTLFVLGLTTCLISVNAQTENIGAKLEELTTQWDEEAKKLSTYEGLSQFCVDKNYRAEMIGTLQGIHHYDSALYEAIAEKARYGGSNEMKKTMKDIEKLQKETSIKGFLNFLEEECVARNDIEKNARKTGEDKDGEVYVLETELAKFVKHITKRVDVIREHVHHLGVR